MTTFTLGNVQHAAFDVARAKPDELNPMVSGVCTYHGTNGTTCLAGAVLLELGIPLPERNCSIRSAPGVPQRFEKDAMTFLSGLQTNADRGSVPAGAEGRYDGDARLPWLEAYHRTCLSWALNFYPDPGHKVVPL